MVAFVPRQKRAWHQNVKRAPKEERTLNGLVFDSKGELKRWLELVLLKHSGVVTNLRRQVAFPLVLPNGVPIKIRSQGIPKGRQCVYTADFVYRDSQGAEIVEEYKGHDDPAARLRRAVVEAIYGFQITMTGAAAKRRPRKPPRLL